MEKEIRNYNGEFETNEESRNVSGYAAVFESLSENMGFYEKLARGSITNETIERSDILCKFNHDSSKVLARSNHGKGTLKLELDERGLKYSFEAPHTAVGDELLEYLKRGDLNSSSFAFTVSKDEDAEKWEKRDGKIYRTINHIDRLYDVSPVFQPAYQETSCNNRFNEITNQSEEIDKIMDLNKKEIEEL